MKNRIWIYLLVLLLTFLLIILFNRLAKPDFENPAQNPYDLSLDSLAQIPPELYLPLDYSYIDLPLPQAKALATDSAGNLLVAGQQSILVLTCEGKELLRFNTPQTATALAVDHQQRIYCALENHLVLYSMQGDLLKTFPELHPGAYITSIAYSPGRIYLAEAVKGDVYEFTGDGEFVKSYGKGRDKTAPDFLNIPSLYFDLAIGPDNSLWVTNTGKHKLVNFHADGSLRSYWGVTSAAPEGFCGCCNPTHIVLMEDGSFITAEKGIVRIKKYNYGGGFIGVLAGPERFGPKAVGLDLAKGTEEQIYVLEAENNKIHCFRLK